MPWPVKARARTLCYIPVADYRPATLHANVSGTALPTHQEPIVK